MKKLLASLALGFSLLLGTSAVMAQATPAPAVAAAPAAAEAKAAAPAAAPAAAAPAAAEAAPAPVPNKGDTAWMTIATVLVILMTIPGLA
jgi:Amt family ammonium transporter